ncbi:uncharacterized protein [Leptinotarsa decemlineata]|uniref:uncharacterized protein n=1 Tax=Leptinotarsa decemlineata TaxID=7539 RepID=UPI003D30C704
MIVEPFISTLLMISLSCHVYTTTDLNSAELQYLADHLTSEECRRLIAAAHFETYQEPNSLDQAQRKIPKDLPCIQQLHHWNSEPGEGKGDTHEALAHRLRQMGKIELADWLGKTVFHQLAVDLNRSLEGSLKELAAEKTSEKILFGPTLVPIVRYSESAEWSMIDTFLYAILLGLILTILGFIIRFTFIGVRSCIKNRSRKVKFKQHQEYDLLEGATSDSESEDKFDLRNHTVRIDSASKGDDN